MRKVNVSAWRDGSLLKNGASLLMVCLLIFSILKISDARFMVKIWDKMYGIGVFKSRRSKVLCRWVVAVRLVETASFFYFPSCSSWLRIPVAGQACSAFHRFMGGSIN